MQELAIKTYLVLEGLADRLVEMRQERGQTAAEYVGVIAFVAAIVAVLVTFGEPIASAVKEKIVGFINSISSG